MTQPESIEREEKLEIERQVSSFVHDFERRSSRSAKLGCFWLMFVGLGALGMRSTSGFAIWGFLTFASFLALGFFLRNQAQRSIGEFQRMFRGTAQDAHRREVALHQLWTMTHPSGRMPNKSAQKLLDGLGLSARPPTPVVRGPIDEETRPPFLVQATVMATPLASTPSARTLPPSSAPRSTPAPHASPVRHVSEPAPSSSRDASMHAASSSRAAPVPSPSPSPTPRSEPAPTVEVRSPVLPSVLGPPSPSTEKRAPAATSTPALDTLVSWRCDACGTEARVPRAEAHRLCPTCFPQIRLDG